MKVELWKIDDVKPYEKIREYSAQVMGRRWSDLIATIVRKS